jgi:ATP-dependent DNA helicase RecG
MRSAQDLLDELNASDESPRIEAKRSREIGRSLMDTVIAFANEPGLRGGWLLLGVDWRINDKGDTEYWPEGVPDPDKAQKDLSTQCASMLNQPLRPEISVERIDGKTLIVVYVAEVDVRQKPIYVKATGLPRGAYRRIGSTDQHCTDEDIWVLRGDTQPQHGPDQAVLTDARMDDFEPAAIAEYRRVRARLNPQAEELDYGDNDLLEALGAVRRVDDRLQPTLAGIVLFGKSMALRRLMPMLRIDYIRVAGTEWVEDPEQRFQSIDIRKPLLLALPQAEASIIDELPKGFHLPEGDLHSRQEPILPRKVIREALANAVMHRNYLLHSPTQIIRYSNRIEILNVGYSLKEPSQLGTPGSRLRNPTIAAVMHDLHLAEAKGTGIRAMRRLAGEAGLPLPEFHSDRQANEFKVTLFLHNLLTEEDYAWLHGLAGNTLGPEEAKVLIYARETGAVDNTACRDFSGLDTLAASNVLRRLRDRGLLEKQGSGSRTYYTLATPVEPPPHKPEQGVLPLQGTEPPMCATDFLDGNANPTPMPGSESPQAPTADAEACNPELATLPPELATLLATLKGRVTPDALRNGIRRLCAWAPLTGDQLATLLDKDRHYLRNKHLIPMVRDGLLKFRYPESAKHPNQAYVAAGDGEVRHG